MIVQKNNDYIIVGINSILLLYFIRLYWMVQKLNISIQLE